LKPFHAFALEAKSVPCQRFHEEIRRAIQLAKGKKESIELDRTHHHLMEWLVVVVVSGSIHTHTHTHTFFYFRGQIFFQNHLH